MSAGECVILFCHGALSVGELQESVSFSKLPQTTTSSVLEVFFVYCVVPQKFLQCHFHLWTSGSHFREGFLGPL